MKERSDNNTFNAKVDIVTSPDNIKHYSQERNDYTELALIAIKQKANVIKYISPSYKDYSILCDEAINQDCKTFLLIKDSVSNYKQLGIKAIMKYPFLVTNLAKEMKNPTRDLTRAIILGLSLVTAVYVLVNYAFMAVLPFKSIMGNANAAYYASMGIFGKLGGKLVTAGILISVYGAANGFMLTGIRTPYILAQANRLPFSDKLGKTSIRTGVPVFAAFLVNAVAIVMILLGNFTVLTDMLVFVMWTFTTLLAIAVIVLRKREPELSRPFKVPLYPVIPLIAILGGTFVVVMTFFIQFNLSVIGLGITLLGLPIYYWKKMH